MGFSKQPNYLHKHCKMCGRLFMVDVHHNTAEYCSNKCNPKAYQIKHAVKLAEKRAIYKADHSAEIVKAKAIAFMELKRDQKDYEKWKLKSKLAMQRYRARNKKV